MTGKAGRIFHLRTDLTAPPRPDDPPLATDQVEQFGFVHCCFREQLAEVAAEWFASDDDLVALELDPARLAAELRFEPSPIRWYPHLYGAVDAAAVVGLHPVARAELPPSLRVPPAGYQLTGVVDGEARSIRWRADGTLDGDPVWCERATSSAADLSGAMSSFTLLVGLTDDGAVVRYDGDGFF